jgi:branched-chain amino acid transport system permease protein
MDLALQTLVNGLLIGAVYLMITLGFNLAFGVLGVIDFAVGEFVMLGAFLGFWLSYFTGWDALVFLPFAFVVFYAGGLLLYPLIGRIAKGRSESKLLMVFVFTFGVSTLLKGSALTVWGFNRRSIDTAFSDSSVILGNIVIPEIRLLAFVCGLAVTALVGWMLYRTRFGLSVRAMAQDEGKARLMGAPTNRIAARVYGLYAGLTGMAGILVGAIYTVTPQMGTQYTILAFFVAVLAGLGYVPGVLLAAALLGLVQAFVTVYASSALSLLVVFLFLYVLLLFAPRGILGKGGA